jgi:hypothetical protein
MDDFDAFIGLDVHKDTIVVAIAEVGRDGQLRYYGVTPNPVEAIDRLLRTSGKKYQRPEFV